MLRRALRVAVYGRERSGDFVAGDQGVVARSASRAARRSLTASLCTPAVARELGLGGRHAIPANQVGSHRPGTRHG